MLTLAKLPPMAILENCVDFRVRNYIVYPLQSDGNRIQFMES